MTVWTGAGGASRCGAPDASDTNPASSMSTYFNRLSQEAVAVSDGRLANRQIEHAPDARPNVFEAVVSVLVGDCLRLHAPQGHRHADRGVSVGPPYGSLDANLRRRIGAPHEKQQRGQERGFSTPSRIQKPFSQSVSSLSTATKRRNIYRLSGRSDSFPTIFKKGAAAPGVHPKIVRALRPARKCMPCSVHVATVPMATRAADVFPA
jgi:hypothetical protein